MTAVAPLDWFNADWIQTATGGRFCYAEPIDPASIMIEDIAHALARECRFGGHVEVDNIYSVGQHCVYVSEICDPADALYGLLHDAAEAYCKDLPRPLKRQPEIRAGYKQIENRVMRAVCARFGLGPVQPASVTKADQILVVTEKRDVMPAFVGTIIPPGVEPMERKIIPWGVAVTYQSFLRRYRELGGSYA